MSSSSPLSPTPNPIDQNNGSQESGENEAVKPEIIKDPTHRAEHLLEMLIHQKGKNNSLEFKDLSDAQKSEMIVLMNKTEDNAFKFHTKKLDTFEKIETLKIKSTTSGHKTYRIIFICALFAALVVTLIILIWKDTFFQTWMAFLTGLMGGAGLSTMSKKLGVSEMKTRKFKDDSDEEDD